MKLSERIRTLLSTWMAGYAQPLVEECAQEAEQLEAEKATLKRERIAYRTGLAMFIHMERYIIDAHFWKDCNQDDWLERADKYVRDNVLLRAEENEALKQKLEIEAQDAQRWYDDCLKSEAENTALKRENEELKKLLRIIRRHFTRKQYWAKEIDALLIAEE